jgi:hypothetical protein
MSTASSHFASLGDRDRCDPENDGLAAGGRGFGGIPVGGDSFVSVSLTCAVQAIGNAWWKPAVRPPACQPDVFAPLASVCAGFAKEDPFA